MSSAKRQPFCLGLNVLTHKPLEAHGRVLNTAATEALVLKHQAVYPQFHTEISRL